MGGFPVLSLNNTSKDRDLKAISQRHIFSLPKAVKVFILYTVIQHKVLLFTVKPHKDQWVYSDHCVQLSAESFDILNKIKSESFKA